MHPQALRLHNSQKQDKEYWVLRKVVVVSCDIGGLLVTHVGRRLLLGLAGRRDNAMPPHNGKKIKTI